MSIDTDALLAMIDMARAGLLEIKREDGSIIPPEDLDKVTEAEWDETTLVLTEAGRKWQKEGSKKKS